MVKIMTVRVNQKYGLTQFDSKYTIPSIKILINSKSYMTDSIARSSQCSVDTLKQKNDIKDIQPAKAKL
jgi:hypothetical protein